MRHLITTLLVLALPASVHAENLCVDPDNANCYATIQAAEDDAADGDTITIRAGVYFENVVVDVPNLEIRGSAKTIVDPDDPNIGPAFDFTASGYMIHGFTIRNGKTDGIRVGAMATDGEIRNMFLTGMNGDCIESLAHGTLIEDNELLFCGSDIVRVIGDDAVVRDNDGKFADSSGIRITGNRAIIDGNSLQNVEDSDGYVVTGDDAEITDNSALGVDNRFISVMGDNAFVHGNRGMVTEDIYIDGGNPTVTDNRMSHTFDQGLNMVCSGCAPGGTVSGNRAEYVSGGDDGFNFSGDLSGLVVEDNLASYIDNNGFRLGASTSDFELSGNRASDVGTSNDDHCFLIDGDDHTLEDSRAEDCHGAGFAFEGSGHLSTDSRSSWTIGTGISFGAASGATNVTVRDATVTDTNGAAFEVRNTATNITIESPAVKGDVGQDACDEGTGTTFTDADELTISLACRITF